MEVKRKRKTRARGKRPSKRLHGQLHQKEKGYSIERKTLLEKFPAEKLEMAGRE